MHVLHDFSFLYFIFHTHIDFFQDCYLSAIEFFNPFIYLFFLSIILSKFPEICYIYFCYYNRIFSIKRRKSIYVLFTWILSTL